MVSLPPSAFSSLVAVYHIYQRNPCLISQYPQQQPRYLLPRTSRTSTRTFRTEPEIQKSMFERNSQVSFLGSNICVDFDLRDSKKMENMK